MIKEIVLAIFVAAAAFGCGFSGNVSENGSRQKPVKEPSEQVPKSDPILSRQIAEIAQEAKGKVGVYAIIPETGESVGLNENERFAMQSVVKLPISMAVLQLVDQGKLRLDETIVVAKDELVPARMHSPFRDKNPNGGEATVEELVKLAMSVSDGTAADVLQRVAGGAEGVQAFIDPHTNGSMKVKYTHKEFSNDNERQFENWATPRAATELLIALRSAAGSERSDTYAPLSGISEQSAKLLLQFMAETPTGPNRLKGLLPPGTAVAHKTGTSGTRDGITFATNDVGIITMPNGDHIVIAVFVGSSPADEKTREAVIARIAKAVFDRWSGGSRIGETAGGANLWISMKKA
ncbi:MAG TPA: class A beta-lactamase [Pyrinomonadaceae bacterium]|nr:class A beta-lactamase [Pyrinomonadaceae bacterium]